MRRMYNTFDITIITRESDILKAELDQSILPQTGTQRQLKASDNNPNPLPT